jgi:hypothetical protein
MDGAYATGGWAPRGVTVLLGEQQVPLDLVVTVGLTLVGGLVVGGAAEAVCLDIEKLLVSQELVRQVEVELVRHASSFENRGAGFGAFILPDV